MLEQEFLTTPEPPAAKRRIHWIIPTAVVVIVVLSVIFYFRNFYPGSQKTEDRSQKTEAERSDVLTLSGSALDSQKPELKTQNSELKTQNSKLKTQNSELKTQNSKLLSVLEGKRLFQLAREVYGEPFLWVLIYKENQAKIPDPDMLLSGTTLAIPALEGKPAELTRNDSIAISEGYRLVYEFYKSKGDPKADGFNLVYKRYSR